MNAYLSNWIIYEENGQTIDKFGERYNFFTNSVFYATSLEEAKEMDQIELLKAIQDKDVQEGTISDVWSLEEDEEDNETDDLL